MKVIGFTYDHTQFTYDKVTRCFTGKISRIPGILRQVWNDSFDIGFGIRGNTQTVYFILSKHITNEEGDTLYWEFEVYNPDHSPALKGLTVKIFND